jgi:hypothetical protein
MTPIDRISKYLQREEDRLLEDLENGLISNKEYNDECKSMERDAREYAQEEAEKAYHDALENW